MRSVHHLPLDGLRRKLGKSKVFLRVTNSATAGQKKSRIGLTGNVFAATLFLLIFATPSSASLVGDTVTYDRREWQGDPQLKTDVVIGSGVELNDDLLDANFAVDFSAEDILLENTGEAFEWNANFDGGFGIEFKDLDWTDEPTGELTGVDITTTASGADLFPRLLTSDSFTLFSDTTFTLGSGDSINMQLETTHTSSVRTPATLALLGLGLAGLGFSLRSRSRSR